MPTASSLAWKTSLRKVRTLWHCSRLRSVALWRRLIVVISVRQSTAAAISGLHCWALVMVSSSIRLTAWLQNSKKRAERSERLTYEQESPRLSPLWLSASSSGSSWAVNHYRDNAITYKAQRDKNARELKFMNAAITDMQMRQRDVAALDAKYTKELADAKAEMMLCVMMLLVVACCTSKQSVSQCVKPPLPPAWIMQPPPDWQTPLNGIISPSERGWSLCKNNWKEPRSILMSSADRVAHIDGQLMAYCEQYTRASSRRLK